MGSQLSQDAEARGRFPTAAPGPPPLLRVEGKAQVGECRAPGPLDSHGPACLDWARITDILFLHRQKLGSFVLFLPS